MHGDQTMHSCEYSQDRLHQWAAATDCRAAAITDVFVPSSNDAHGSVVVGARASREFPVQRC
jgi:uncharacterized protein YecE (DUF72 family)